MLIDIAIVCYSHKCGMMQELISWFVE